MNTNNTHKCKAASIRTLDKFDVSKLIGAPFKVTLTDTVLEKSCDQCGEVRGHIIPKAGELVSVVAVLRACEPVKLNGPEIRFLRKSLHLNGKEFAERIDLSSTHLSKLENGHEPITPRTERSLRMHVCLGFLDCLHSTLLKKITDVPTMAIKSVRIVDEELEFSLSLQPTSSDQTLPDVNDDDHKRYTNVA